jgi:uncharacterized membrane protein (UPF0127 family)
VSGRRGSRLRIALLVALAAAGSACSEPAPPAPPPAPETAWVEIAGELFELELALDPATRFQGLSDRPRIPRNGGMLFVQPRPRPLSMVMRRCPVPIDVAFADDTGRVVAIHAMAVEPPRAPGESVVAYEARLPTYASGVPVRFAVETAGGRLEELGLAVGDRLVFDTEALARRAR